MAGQYDYARHGVNWNNNMDIGRNQSPIDIQTTSMDTQYSSKMNINFHYNPIRHSQLEKFIYSLKVPANEIGTIEVTDVNGQGPYLYHTDHIHFHGPAEHRIDGVQHDLELHFVHTLIVKDPFSETYKQTLAVVGVIFKLGAQSHPFIEKLRIEDMGHIDRANVNELFEGQIDKETGLKTSPGFYHYQGSLTTPPCTENVNWFVYKDVLTISEAHLKAFNAQCHDHHGHTNFREVQPLNERVVARNFQ